jgi:hypothetical protein
MMVMPFWARGELPAIGGKSRYNYERSEVER